MHILYINEQFKNYDKITAIYLYMCIRQCILSIQLFRRRSKIIVWENRSCTRTIVHLFDYLDSCGFVIVIEIHQE